MGISTSTSPQHVLAGVRNSLGLKCKVSLVAEREFEVAVKAHTKTENAKATAQISSRLLSNELSLLETLKSFGELRGLFISKGECRATFYEHHSLEAALRNAKAGTCSDFAARRYHANGIATRVSRSRSPAGQTVPISRSMFRSSDLLLENTLQIEKSTSNEIGVTKLRRSHSVKHLKELQADAGLNHKKVMSELLFLQIGRKEPLAYGFSAEVSVGSTPSKAAQSYLSADDESDGYTVVPTQAKQLPTVKIVPVCADSELDLDDSLKSKPALLMLKTQCNSEEAASLEQVQLEQQHNSRFSRIYHFCGTQGSTSDEGLPRHSNVQVLKHDTLVPVTVVTENRSTEMSYFMYPLY